jgi:putative membrane protein
VLLVLLALMVVAALVAFLVVRIANRRVPPPSGFALAGPPMSDPALSQLRLRYARGEISRDDYLQTSADLGAQPPPLPI